MALFAKSTKLELLNYAIVIFQEPLFDFYWYASIYLLGLTTFLKKEQGCGDDHYCYHNHYSVD